MERINAAITCDTEVDKHKETLSVYNIKGEENILSTSEKKEKSRDSYVRMYEYRKHLLHSTYEYACAAQETTISKMK